MNLLNVILPWRRKRIAQVTAALDDEDCPHSPSCWQMDMEEAIRSFDSRNWGQCRKCHRRFNPHDLLVRRHLRVLKAIDRRSKLIMWALLVTTPPILLHIGIKLFSS